MMVLRNFKPEDISKICDFKEESADMNFPSSDFDKDMFKKNLFLFARRNPDMIKVI